MTKDEIVGWHPESMNMSLSKFWELITDREPGVVQSMGSQRVGNNS